jgi:bifunctional DNA-binding transcriptional regulator/antitoxin component of YhaV-PrlF toxin-antitoxin module
MVKTSKKKNEGFMLEISPEIADILGINKQDDLRIIIRDNEIILKAKKENLEHIKKKQEKSKKLTEKLINQFSPVLKKLAKT